MDLQEIFNIAAPKMLEQGCKSQRPNTENCLYRGPNNTKCWVGFLIPDELYTEQMEEEGSIDGNCLVWEALVQADVIDGPIVGEFLSDGQTIHDIDPVEDWKERLLDLAHLYNLDASCIQ